MILARAITYVVAFERHALSSDSRTFTPELSRPGLTPPPALRSVARCDEGPHDQWLRSRRELQLLHILCTVPAHRPRDETRGDSVSLLESITHAPHRVVWR